MSTDNEESETGAAEAAPAFAKVKVTGPGIAIERPVNEAAMASIIAILFGARLPAPDGGGGGTGGGAGGGTGGAGTGGGGATQWDADLTLGEFLVETQAKTFPQKICAAGYYMIRFEGASSFNREDVRTALGNAHEDMPANFSRDWSAAAGTNLIATKQGESGQYIVPTTGRKAVESYFSEVPKARPRKRAAKKSTGSAE